MEDKFKLLLYAQHHRGIDRSNCHGHRTSNGYVVSWNEYEGILLFPQIRNRPHKMTQRSKR